jgi:hypothetical protein
MRGHQPGSQPIRSPDVIPNPAYTPGEKPERAPATPQTPAVPERVKEPAR